ncbi:hypothetical protein ES703_90030 [subsurface metagenome]
MVQQLDPIQRVLLDLSKMRGDAFNEMLRLPAPDPFKEVLREVDQILSQTEDHIKAAKVTVLLPLKLAESGMPEKWARNLREMVGFED